MRLVYITLARKILCYGSFPAKVLLGTNAYNSLVNKTQAMAICACRTSPWRNTLSANNFQTTPFLARKTAPVGA